MRHKEEEAIIVGKEPNDDEEAEHEDDELCAKWRNKENNKSLSDLNFYEGLSVH